MYIAYDVEDGTVSSQHATAKAAVDDLIDQQGNFANLEDIVIYKKTNLEVKLGEYTIEGRE